MQKYYVYIPPNGSNCLKFHKIPVPKKPDHLWTLYGEPNDDLVLMHGKNAFIEDYVHDWNWSKDNPEYIRYYSRITDGDTWIVLIYDKE